MPFEAFEHTADIGIHLTAPSVEALFADAARAVVALIVENPDAVEPRERITIALAAENVEGLFVDWLGELIYRFEIDHLLLPDCVVRLSEDTLQLEAECHGERADWTRHHPDNELKAVTYHQLRVARTADGWEATVVFDI
jgi:SHS2 domain-containing protein